tara:strand:- start:892 stop:1152 length:261 start_codon:yes stop_codon:yes gene_type:complete
MKTQLSMLIKSVIDHLENNPIQNKDQEEKFQKLVNEIKHFLPINKKVSSEIKEDVEKLKVIIEKMESKMIEDSKIFDEFINFLEKK